MVDIRNYLIFLKKEEKTIEIQEVERSGEKTKVTFINKNTKAYFYNDCEVEIFQNPSSIDPKLHYVLAGSKELVDIQEILSFEKHTKIFFNNGSSQLYLNELLEISPIPKVLQYLTKIAKVIGNKKSEKDEDSEYPAQSGGFLLGQYQKMRMHQGDILKDSILAKYLSGEQPKSFDDPQEDEIIFPFGLNLSQEKALKRVFSHQVSIIEGPPGTGKTQTILNIVSNILLRGKTVAVVSNNNSAVDNIYEKFDALGLSFFMAKLGNQDNRKKFFDAQLKKYPSFDIKTDDQHGYESLKSKVSSLREILQVHNDLAQAIHSMEELRLERTYFANEVIKSLEIDHLRSLLDLSRYSVEEILSLLAEIEKIEADGVKNVTLFIKIKFFIKFRITSFSLYNYSLKQIAIFLKEQFYVIKTKELEEKISTLEKKLSGIDFENVLNEYKDISMEIFKSMLSQKYKSGEQRKEFDKDSFRCDDFMEEYPVLLSTTHSLRECKKDDYLFDYLIIDEASQVDLVAGGLALSCAKNAVIVGDLKQLPPVIEGQMVEKAKELLYFFSIEASYDYQKSLLESISRVFPHAPKTLLREHYRCHPKIIDFCNKKFYNGELIILTKNCEETSPIVLIEAQSDRKTESNKCNMHQICSISKHLSDADISDAACISPFKAHNQQSREVFKGDNIEIEVNTVHKYQGREKDTIILSTVVDQENSFVDDPRLLNVAISRAKKRLYVAVSDRGQNQNIKDLVEYIKYNHFEVIESKLHSIFDILFKSYCPHSNKHRISLLDKYKARWAQQAGRSKYSSENLMYDLIQETLSEQFSSLALDVSLNYPLRWLIKNKEILEEEELRFVNSFSHVDFLLYSKVSKRAALAIEVDGVSYHRNNPQQKKRDELKNRILEKYQIPLLRFCTNDFEEKEKLIKKLKEIKSQTDQR